MGQGDLSPPLQAEQGWNILLLEERREADPGELTQARGRIVATLTRRAQLARARAYAQELLVRWSAILRDDLITEENFLRGPYAPEQQQADEAVVLAEFGGEKLSLAEFRRWVRPDTLAQMPPSVALSVVRRQLEQQVNERLLSKEAARLGYGERPVIAKEVRRIREDITLNRLLGEVVLARVSITEEEARAYYDSHLQAFTDPEQIKISLIRVESKEEAQEVLAVLQSGQEFAALARARSKDNSTARVGGELGWVARGHWNPELERAAFPLSVGQIVAASAGDGYYVLRVDGRKEPVLQPFAKARGRATQAALRLKQQQEFQRWIARLRAASTISVDQEAIDRAVGYYREQSKKRTDAAKPGEPNKPSDESKTSRDSS
jgi:parvulin-like peptidyl-prolyl isomerase